MNKVIELRRDHLNNMNNIKNINDSIKNVNDYRHEDDITKQQFFGNEASPSSEKKVSHLGHKVKWPAEFKSVKVDLFDNATIDDLKLDKRRFKIAFNTIMNSSKKIKMWAALTNDRFRDFGRSINKQGAHYRLVKQLYEEAKTRHQEIDTAIVSKFYEVNASVRTTVDNASCLLIRYVSGEYVAVIVLDTEYWECDLNTNVTVKQRTSNCIASYIHNEIAPVHRRTWREKFGIKDDS